MITPLHRFLALFATVFALAACSNASDEGTPVGEGDASYEQEETTGDPLESLNRGVFKFNEVVDGVVIKPATQIYRGVVPEVGRKGVSNVVSNLSSPVTLVNSVLQGDPKNAFTTLWRFILNTTLGVGGLFDFAGYYGINNHPEDFGQTLGTYGVKSGPYLVLPIIGPSSTRDMSGRVVDVLTDPLTWALETDELAVRGGVSVLDTRARSYEVIEDVYKNSLDPYATLRSGYQQKREAEIKNFSSPFRKD